MRLRVRVIGAEQRAGEFVGARLDDVDVVAARIQTMTGAPSAYLSLSQFPIANKTAGLA